MTVIINNDTNVGTEVYKFLQDHAGTPFHVSTIADRLGKRQDSVNNACAVMARQPLIPVIRARRGMYLCETDKAHSGIPEYDPIDMPAFPEEVWVDKCGCERSPDVSRDVPCPLHNPAIVKAGSGQTMATIRTADGQYVTGVVQSTWEVS